MHSGILSPMKKHCIFCYIFIYYVHFSFIDLVILTFFSCLRIALERPTETAMLLSLTGVGSVITPQWYTTLQENAERLETLFECKCLCQLVCVLLQTLVYVLRDCVYLLSPVSSSFAPYQILPGVSIGGELHAAAALWFPG